MQTISAWDLVVGDIIQLKPGDKCPADCIVLNSANLAVAEPKPRDVDAEEELDGPEYDTNQAKDAMNDPFLYADSYVTRGICKVLVCVVGEFSTRGIKDTKYDTRENETELSRRLDNIGGSLKFLGLITSIVVLGTAMIVLFINKGVDETLDGGAFTDRLVNSIIVALILLIVAIPEGLPMTVSVSLAFSVLQMSEDDNLLVRDVDSVEKVGQITDLVLGKTGTMTTEEMTVHSFFAQNHKVLNSRPNTFQYCELDEGIQHKIIESIVWNSSAYIEMSDNSFYVPEG
jgi:Ca2+-transporting ATPase